MSPVIVPAVLVAIIIAMAAFLLVGDGWHSVLCHGKPITASDADLNRDGHVTFTEASYACDGGTRAVEQDGEQCVEYYAYKDGLPIKVVCPSTPVDTKLERR